MLWPIKKIKIFTENSNDKEILKFEDQKYNLFSILQNHKIFNQLIIENTASTDGTKLNTALPDTPFYVTINQLVDARFYQNNSFYIKFIFFYTFMFAVSPFTTPLESVLVPFVSFP